jgi:hypothetical protein
VVSNVVLQVEVLVIHPNRVFLEWYPGEPLTVAGNHVQLGLDELADPIGVYAATRQAHRFRLEEDNAGNVHVG